MTSDAEGSSRRTSDATIRAVRVAHLDDIAFVGSTMVRALRARGVDAVLIDPARPGAGAGYPTRLVTRPLRLAALLAGGLEVRRRQFDLTHVHYARFGFLGPLTGVPFVLECHGTDVRGVRPGSLWGREIAPFLHGAAAVLYATPDLRPWVEAFRPDASFLPNPVEPLRAATDRADPDRDVLVAVRLDEVKGSHRIAEVLRDLTSLRPATSVTIVDHGPLVGQVAAAAGGHVKIVRPVAHARMPALIGRHRVAIGQQGIGSLGNLELEMLAAGVPVAASYRRWELYPEDPPLADDGADGRAPSRLAVLLDDAEARAALARRGLDWIRRYHDPAVAADRLVALYESVLGSPGRGRVRSAPRR